MGKALLLCLSLILWASNLHADYKDFYFQRYKNLKNNKSFHHLSVNIMKQKIDHNNSDDTRVFNQRYYIDKSNADQLQDAPVLLYICGEATCNPSSLSGQIFNWAKHWRAVMVALEHRYYGKSQPFKDLSTEHLKYLTTDQALKDLKAFQEYITKKEGLTGKWIVIGGSYAGSLSSDYRLKYPDMVVGSLASSAPVMAKENFEEYDAHITKVAGPKCVAKIREVATIAEDALSDPDELLKLKKLFVAEAIRGKTDFLYLIADLSALAIQYGYKDKFCEMIENDNPVNGYAEFAKYIYNSWQIDALSFSFQSAESLNPADYEKDFGMRQWLYQSCTEYGYWQTANHDPEKSARSKKINLEYHRAVCKKYFGLTAPVNTEITNEKYYFPIFNSTTTNILYTDGSTDPWSLLSVNSQTAEQNPNITFNLINGAAHCDDLRPSSFFDSSYLLAARKLFTDLGDKWLN